MTDQRLMGASPYWHGLLHAGSQGRIAERMREVLHGRYFTLVVCNSYDENSERFSAVEVYPSQWLMSGPLSDGSSIRWNTPRFAMSVHTDAETVQEALESPHEYVHFDFDGDRITIDHYAPARYKLRWILAVERHDAEGPGWSE